MTSDQYLAAVQDHLLDLPWRVRKNLAEDLRVHLKEIPDEDLVERSFRRSGSRHPAE
jgi:hypothetical protein